VRGSRFSVIELRVVSDQHLINLLPCVKEEATLDQATANLEQANLYKMFVAKYQE